MHAFADEVITAHGVRLRPLSEADVPAIASACSDALTQQWLPLPRPYTEDSARVFALEVAPRALTSGNAASIATAQRALFVREGVLRRAGITHDGPVDLVVFSRLESDVRPRF